MPQKKKEGRRHLSAMVSGPAYLALSRAAEQNRRSMSAELDVLLCDHYRAMPLPITKELADAGVGREEAMASIALAVRSANAEPPPTLIATPFSEIQARPHDDASRAAEAARKAANRGLSPAQRFKPPPPDQQPGEETRRVKG